MLTGTISWQYELVSYWSSFLLVKWKQNPTTADFTFLCTALLAQTH